MVVVVIVAAVVVVVVIVVVVPVVAGTAVVVEEGLECLCAIKQCCLNASNLNFDNWPLCALVMKCLKSASMQYKRPMGLDALLENQLSHGPKFQKLHIYPLCSPGVRN